MTWLRDLIVRIKEEPTIVTQVVQAVLALLVAFEILVLTQEQTTAILAITSAMTALALGLAVRPFKWPLVIGLVNSAIVLLASFGFDLTSEQIGAVNAITVVLGMLLVRYQVTPEAKMTIPVNPDHGRPPPSTV